LTTKITSGGLRKREADEESRKSWYAEVKKLFIEYSTLSEGGL